MPVSRCFHKLQKATFGLLGNGDLKLIYCSIDSVNLCTVQPLLLPQVPVSKASLCFSSSASSLSSLLSDEGVFWP